MPDATRSASSARSSARFSAGESSRHQLAGRAQARHAELLARAGISGRYAWPEYMIAAGYDPAGAAGLLAALSRDSALEARVQGRTNRQTPEWAQHPPAERESHAAGARRSACDRAARAGGSATATRSSTSLKAFTSMMTPPRASSMDRRLRIPTCASSSACRRVISCPTAPTRSRSPVRRARRSSAAASFSGSLDNAFCRFRSSPAGSCRLIIPQPQRLTINGMPAAVTTAHVNTEFRTDRRERRRLSVGCAADLSFRDADARRLPASDRSFRWSIRYAGLVRRSGGDPAADHPHRNGEAGRYACNRSPSRMAYRDFKLERFLSLNGLAANSALAPGPEGQAGGLRHAADLTAPTYGMTCSHVVAELAPHAADAAAKRLKAAHHRDDDQRGNQAVFDRSCSALVRREACAISFG